MSMWSDKAAFARKQIMSRIAGVVVSYCRNTGMTSKATHRLFVAAMDFRGGIEKFNATYEDFGAHLLGLSRSPSAWKSAVSRDVATHKAELETSGYPGLRVTPGFREVDRVSGNIISATPASWDFEAFPYLVEMLKIAHNLERKNRRKTKSERMKREALYDEAFRLAKIPYKEPRETNDRPLAPSHVKASDSMRLEGFKLAIQRVTSYARSARLKLIEQARENGIGPEDLAKNEMATCELLKERIDYIYRLPPDQLKRRIAEDDITVAASPVVKNSCTTLEEPLPEQITEKAVSGSENDTGFASFFEEIRDFHVLSSDRIEQAQAAFVALSSIGVEKVNIHEIDDRLIAAAQAEKDKSKSRRLRKQAVTTHVGMKITKLRAEFDTWLSCAEEKQLSLVIDPRLALGARLIQVDESDEFMLDLLSDLSLYTIETSIGNGQAILVLPDGLTKEQYDEIKERLFSAIKPMGVNNGSSGASRWPGSFNFKLSRQRDDGSFPLVKLRASNAGRIVTPEELESLGLLPIIEKPKQQRKKLTKLPFGWPAYDDSLASVDRSRADWKFIHTAKEMGWPRPHIDAKLREISNKAQQRDKHGSNKYVEHTVHKAFNESRSKMSHPPSGRDKGVL